MTGKMNVLVPEAATVEWDTEVVETVKEAERIFAEQRAAGLLPISLGENATQVHAFDPTVKEISWLPQMAGG